MAQIMSIRVASNLSKDSKIIDGIKYRLPFEFFGETFAVTKEIFYTPDQGVVECDGKAVSHLKSGIKISSGSTYKGAIENAKATIQRHCESRKDLMRNLVTFQDTYRLTDAEMNLNQ